MRWHIAGPVRATIHAFSGVNFSGVRSTVQIWPVGGRQGDEIDGERLKCIGLIAPVGTRIILAASSGERWAQLPWRALEIRQGHTFESRDGHPAVQVPDLDFFDPPAALRSDPDQWPYPHADNPDERPDWSYGRIGTVALKGKVRQIFVDRIG